MFLDTLNRYLGWVPNETARRALGLIFGPLYDRQVSRCLTSAGLVIKAGGSTLVKTGGSATHLIANGILQKISSATDMPALSGTVTNATFNAWWFFCDSAGTVTSLFGTAGATRAAMKPPQFPIGKALIGFVIINPTGTGDFVGGTTALDDATVTPNAEYVSAIGGFDPYCLTPN